MGFKVGNSKVKDMWKLKVDVSTYNATIYAFGSLDMNDEALKMLMSIKTKGLELEVSTYMSMIIIYVKAYLIEGDKRMFKKIEYKGF